MKTTKSSPKGKIVNSKNSAKEEKVAKPKIEREIIPINEDPSSWKVDLHLGKDKEGLVTMPVTGTFQIPLVSGQKVKVHGKLQGFLNGVIDEYNVVRGGKENNNFAIRMNRYQDDKKTGESGLKVEQRDLIFKHLGKFVRDAVAKNNNVIKDSQKAESAALRKASRQEKGVKTEKIGSPIKKSPISKSPVAKKVSPKAKKG